MTVSYVCPRCRGPLNARVDVFRCERCEANYPIVAGIPDFRIFADPWISIEEDRAKAIRVQAATAGLDFEASVRAYWAMTPDTPRRLVDHYVNHVLTAEDRSREWLGVLQEGPVPAGPWLDLGCGTGDLLAAASAMGTRVVGADIALRWLVVARKRRALAERVSFVCCCAEALPFPERTFARVTALGLLEHCGDPEPVCREALRVLTPAGAFALRTVNRYSLLPEPHVQVWGVGFLPRRLADRYVRWRSGRRYLHHRPLSAREVRQALRRTGFIRVSVGAARVLETERRRLRRAGRWLAPVYSGVRATPGAGRALAYMAPLLEAVGVAP